MGRDETGVRVVLLTAADRESAEALGRTLVEERLAACANVLGGAVSVYRWEGAVERSEEAIALLKVSAGGVDALLARAAELHPYDVPELLVLPVEAGHPPYLDWVRDACAAGPGKPR